MRNWILNLVVHTYNPSNWEDCYEFEGSLGSMHSKTPSKSLSNNNNNNKFLIKKEMNRYNTPRYVVHQLWYYYDNFEAVDL